MSEPETGRETGALRAVRGSEDSLDFEVDGTVESVPERENTGRYQIIRPLAEGGLGKVSVAFDTELQREVALKQIKPQHSENENAQHRFLREAEVTGKLEHPGIVPVYGLGLDSAHSPFYAMRLIRGETMSVSIARLHRHSSIRFHLDRAELQKLLRRFIDVCNTMAYAHSEGIIHRDLKPGNIMLGPYGETLVVDWGLAKRIASPEELQDVETTNLHQDLEFQESESPPPNHASPGLETTIHTPDPARATDLFTPGFRSDDNLTLQGQVIGTLPYMSPEQASGDVNQLTTATDVYSLGAILYTILTARGPFSSTARPEMRRAVMRGNFPSPRQIHHSIPLPLEAICLRAMSLAPSHRHATAKELAEEIEAWMADEPTASYRESLLERAMRLSRRHRSWATAIFASACLLTIVSLVALVLINRSRQTAYYQSEVANALRLAREADSLRTSAPVRGALLALESLKTIPSSTEGPLPQSKAAVFNALSSVGGRPVIRLQSFPIHLIRKEPSRWISVDANINVQRWNVGDTLSGTKQEWSCNDYEHGDAPGFDPRGNFLAVGKTSGSVELWDLRNSPPKKIESRCFDSFIDFAGFDRQGKWLVTTAGQSAVLWDLRKGVHELKEHSRFILSDQYGHSYFYRIPTQRLLLVGGVTNVDCFDTSTFPPTPVATEKFPRNERVGAQSLDESKIATIRGFDTLRVWNATEQSLDSIDFRVPEVQEIDNVIFSNDGRLVAIGSASGACAIVDTAATERSHAVQLLKKHEDRVTSLAFAPSGRRCAVGSRDGLIRVWDLHEDAQPYLVCELRGHDGNVNTLFFESQTVLVTGGHDNTIRRWNLEDELDSPVFRRSFFGAYGWHLNFVRDGKLVVGGREDYVQVKDLLGPPSAIRSLTYHNLKVVPTETYSGNAVSRDGRWLVVSDGLKFRSYDLQSENLSPHFEWNVEGFERSAGLDFSSDGRYLVSVASSNRIWRFENGKPQGESIPLGKKGASGFACRISPNNRWIAVADMNDATLFRFGPDEQPREAFVFPKAGMMEGFDFSPDGKEFAKGGEDGVIQLYRLTDQAPPTLEREFPGHFNGVDALRYSPDGKWIASCGSQDATIRLWELGSKESRPRDIALRSGVTYPRAIAFSPDSGWLAASFEDGFVRAWNLELKIVAEEIKQRAGRELTQEERGEFFLLKQ